MTQGLFYAFSGFWTNRLDMGQALSRHVTLVSPLSANAYDPQRTIKQFPDLPAGAIYTSSSELNIDGNTDFSDSTGDIGGDCLRPSTLFHVVPELRVVDSARS